MKKYNALVYGFGDNFFSKIKKNLKKKINFKIYINSTNNPITINQEILLRNLEKINFKSNNEIIKNYENFFSNNFVNFYKMILSRGINFRNFHETKNEFSIFLNFFANEIKKKKINLVILQSIPHQGPDYVLYILAKFYNVKTIMFYQSIIPQKFFIVNNIEDFGNFRLVNNLNKKKITFEEIRSLNLEKYRKMVKDIHEFNINRRKNNKNIKFLIKNKIRSSLVNLKMIERKDEEKEYMLNIKKFLYKGNLNKLINKKFVYFPLHDQPEMTTVTLGGIYEDQILAIEHLRTILKRNEIIIVKDHNYQSSFQRDKFFFKRLKNIKNVHMVPSTFSSLDLVRKALFTATITGTAGWESLLEKKNCLIFGNAWYQKIDGCIKFDIEKKKKIYDLLLKKKFDEKKFCKSFLKILNCSFNGVINPYYKPMLNKLDENYNSNIVSKQILDMISK